MQKNKTKRLAPKKESICIHLPHGYKDILGKLAFENDRSMSAMIRRGIDALILKETGKNMRAVK